MSRLRKAVTSSLVGAALVAGSLIAASPATAATTEIQWIQLPTQARCNTAVDSLAKSAAAKGYTNIRASNCIFLSTRNIWEAWVSYTVP